MSGKDAAANKPVPAGAGEQDQGPSTDRSAPGLPQDASAVKVAVRVRPLLSHETRNGASHVVTTHGNTITVEDPAAKEHFQLMAGSHGQPRVDDPKLLAQFRRSFAFDAVFDSSGGPQESAPRATQQDVFDNLGT